MIPVKVTIASTTELQPALIDFARAAATVAGTPAGDVTAALRAVEARLDAELPGQSRDAAEALRAELPKGVKLVALTHARDGLEVTATTTLELDDVAKLSRVKAFDGFLVTKRGERVRVSGTAPDARVALTVECDVTPSEHNATRVEGSRLTWEGRGFEVAFGF